MSFKWSPRRIVNFFRSYSSKILHETSDSSIQKKGGGLMVSDIFSASDADITMSHQKEKLSSFTATSTSTTLNLSPKTSTAAPIPQLLINCLKNNIFLNLTNPPGHNVFTLSSGKAGYPDSQKTSSRAALALLDVTSKKLAELGFDTIKLNFRGLNAARPIIVAQLRRMGIKITEVIDSTGVPHNGCRPPKKKRL